MKKQAISFLLALVLVCALLTGCAGGGDEAKLEGTWATTLELADQFNKEFEAGGMGDYIQVDSFPLVMKIQFKSDGTYAAMADEEALNDTMEGLRGTIRDGLSDYAQSLIEGEGWDASVEEVFEAMGTSLDGLVEEFFQEVDVSSMVADTAMEGNFKARGGKLHLSDGLDHLVDPKMYDVYELEGDTLTLLESVGGGETDQFAGLYPLTLKKVG